MALDAVHDRRSGVRDWNFLVRRTSSVFNTIAELTQSSRFGWTGYSGSNHWMVPTAAGIPIGFGMVTIFMQGWNYLLDSYREL